ncbi:hypothetical protein Lal_00032862 [Lupinus albus]|nr:hypothetical protein Lal_00032862 [Lupinus albus]
MDKRERVAYYTSDKTDELEQYDITVNKYVYGKELNTKGCSVRLVSSPDYVCNILTPTLVVENQPDTNASNSESEDPHEKEGHY